MSIARLLTFAFGAALVVGCSNERVTTPPSDESPRLNIASTVACAQRVNNTIERLLECVRLEGLHSHLTALQAIADANNGTRVSGTAGFDLSKDYVADKLRAAGYAVTVQPFQFATFLIRTPTVVAQVSPGPAGPVAATTLSYSGSGDVTAPVTNVPSLGCNAGDFAGFPVGNIALVTRGVCTFAIKATNAYNAGAVAVVVVNNVAGNLGATLGADFTIDMPVVGVTQTVGQQFAATPALVLRVRTDTFRGIVTSYNVIAETPDGDPENVVMVGAHLDAVNAGAGIQDNGSGTAAVLETALQMARVKPRNKVRFVLWGAEESGLVGSIFYVNTLSEPDLNRIALYLNFDMIASPNYVLTVYDGDNSDGLAGPAHPDGSGAIESLFASFYQGRGMSFLGSNIVNGSDHRAFVGVGIPVGGLFTGALALKSPEQASIWGGTAGVAFDPCYHQACDVIANVNTTALELNADAVAFATLNLAMNTSQVNGGKPKGNFRTKSGAAANAMHDAQHLFDR